MVTNKHATVDWTIEVLNDGERLGDDGREIGVALVHQNSGLSIVGSVAYYGTDGDIHPLQLLSNDFALDAHTASRLIVKLAREYVLRVGEFGDVGLSIHVSLREAVCALYAHFADADFVISQIETAVRSFAP